MATFTAARPLNMNFQGHDLRGDPGTVFRIPDSLKAEFDRNFGYFDLSWVQEDEIASAGGGTTGPHNHDALYIGIAHGTAVDPHVQYALDADLANHETAGHVHNHDAAYAPIHSHPYEPSGAVATHAAAVDPHPTYLTAAEGAAAYAALSHAHIDADIPAGIARDSEVTAAVNAHAAAGDPHPGYLTPAEGNAAYSALGHTHAGGGGVDIKSGIVNLTAGGSVVVTFATPFLTVPHVVALSQFATTDVSSTLSASSVTVNGFTLRGAGNAAGNVAWIATTAGNP